MLGGAALQIVGLTVHSSSFCCQIIERRPGPSWAWAADVIACTILAVVGAVVLFTTRSRLVSAGVAGGSLIGMFTWLAFMFSNVISSGYQGDWNLGAVLWWTGAVGASGAALAFVGGLAGALPGPLPSVAVRAAIPAGWYPDPGGRGQRWWDGYAWTEQARA
jgi:hypothetical protein